MPSMMSQQSSGLLCRAIWSVEYNFSEVMLVAIVVEDGWVSRPSAGVLNVRGCALRVWGHNATQYSNHGSA